MLDFADVVAVNKFDRQGAHRIALRDVAKQIQRNREAFATPVDEMPVFGTISSRFNDHGVAAVYGQLLKSSTRAKVGTWRSHRHAGASRRFSEAGAGIVPLARRRYLAEIVDTVRSGPTRPRLEQVRIARERQQIRETRRMLREAGAEEPSGLADLHEDRDRALDPRCRKLIEMWPTVRETYGRDEFVVRMRDKEIRTRVLGTQTTLAGSRMPGSRGCRARGRRRDSRGR